ncbi:MAG: DNA polymerase III subunit beta [Akkermansiaceae bacterium]|nr:DNA polymerase III subunit beta [Akkermansiaceae bacterium]
MKFALAKQVLLDGLNKVVGVVSSRPSMPILSNVLLEAKESELKLTTVNGELTIQAKVPCLVESAGAITLPAKKLQSIIRELRDGEVSIEVKGHEAKGHCNRTQFKLYGLPAEDFPQMAVLKEACEFEVPQAMFNRGFRYTEFAIANDASRYMLTGIYTCFQSGKLTLVATDGRRLALFENELEFPESQQMCFNLPSRSVAEIHRLLGDAGNVLVRATSSLASFDLGDTLIITKLIDGNYPNYRQVIPSHYNERISMPAQDLREAVSRVSLLAAEKRNTVLFHITPGSMVVQSGAADLGEASEDVPIDYSGRELSITFNADYVLSPLKAIGENEVNLDFIDVSSPGVMRVANEFLYVLMPMHSA